MALMKTEQADDFRRQIVGEVPKITLQPLADDTERI